VFYRVESFQGEIAVFDALTRNPVHHQSPDLASELAMKQIQSEEYPTKVELLRETHTEYKGPLPAFQISREDFRRTHFYRDPWTGRIIAKRNMIWRIVLFSECCKSWISRNARNSITHGYVYRVSAHLTSS
jgi:hypothetical protein